MDLATRFRRWAFGVLLICAAGVGLGMPQYAEARTASMVVDADTGQILHATNANTRNYPASLTKMMTLYMTFDALDRGNLRLDSRVPMSRHAASQPPSKLAIKVGRSITVHHAILALVTKSANDVAAALAEKIGGTESQFAAMMTKRARRMGMARTTFRNASGLPDRQQLSTARDMATLGMALLRHFPHYYHYFSTRSFSYAGKNYRNHNRLLGKFPGMDGIKTGYIRASGFNLVASARRDGRRLIGVVFGGNTSKQRNAKMASLLSDGFDMLRSGRASSASYDVVGGQLGTPAARASAGTRWGIQVGAFRQRAPATKTAQSAARHVAKIMPGSEPLVEKSRRGNGTVYYLARVRYGQKGAAQNACQALEARKFRCLVLRMTSSDPQVASVGAPLSLEPPTTKPDQLIELANAGFSTATAAPVGTWGVQVGAFPARTVAETTAERALEAAPTLLANGDVAVSPLAGSKHGKLFRARVVGITREQAEQACRRLEGEKFACFVLRL